MFVLIRTMALIKKNWNFLNEGNQHIVLELLNSACVLRLIKMTETYSSNTDEMERIVDFVNFVAKPLLLNSLVEKEDLVILSTEEVTKLPDLLLDYRPKNRIKKSTISSFAIRAPNLTILNTELKDNFCIEIKPKEGFMSKKLKDLGKCFYCLKQYSKMSENQIEKISNYCPLNFFSGDRKRMFNSIFSLLENPQNNWKIFHNSKLIFGDKTKDPFEKVLSLLTIFQNTSNFINFVIEVLLGCEVHSELLLNDHEAVTEDESNHICCEGVGPPPQSFLYKLLSLQKLKTATIHPQSNTDYVKSMLDTIRSENLDLTNVSDRTKFLQSLDSFQLSMLSAIYRDCSLMISFSTVFIEGYTYIKVGEYKVPYKISVTDLEPKHPDTLCRRVKTELKLIEMYKKQLIQPHNETRIKQLEAWQQLITDYLKINKQSTIDIREAQNSPLFNNASICRKLSQESILIVLENMAKSGKAAQIDKSKNIWEVYWHSLDEWGNMIYSWVCNNGLNNTVCTLFELREGDTTTDEEFHGLDMNVLIKALKTLQVAGKCEIMEFDDNQGVKFF